MPNNIDDVIELPWVVSENIGMEFSTGLSFGLNSLGSILVGVNTVLKISR